MYLFNNIMNKFWHIYGLHVRYSKVFFIIENSCYRKHTYMSHNIWKDKFKVKIMLE